MMQRKKINNSFTVKLNPSLQNALEYCKMQQPSLVPTVKYNGLNKNNNKKNTLVQCLLQSWNNR